MESIRSTIQISDADREQLRNLLHMNIVSRDGFAHAGKRLADKHSTLSMRFHQFSQERNEFCEKLGEIVEASQKEPIQLNLEDAVVEAHRREGYIKQAYETAIGEVLDPRLCAILKHQYESIKWSFSWLDELIKENDGRNGNTS
jgi:hypothetical protein